MVTENMGFGVGFCQSTAPHPSPPTLSASPCGNVWKTVFERVWWPLLRPCPRCVHSTSARRANKKIVVRRRCRQTPLQTSVEVGWQSAPEPRHAQQRASRSNRKRQQPTLDTSGPPNMKTAALDGRNKRNFLEAACCVQWKRASTIEAERSNPTLRLHFKAPEIISARSLFKEEINATHPCKFLRHCGCPPFALKCVRCVGSDLSIR